MILTFTGFIIISICVGIKAGAVAGWFTFGISLILLAIINGLNDK